MSVVLEADLSMQMRPQGMPGEPDIFGTPDVVTDMERQAEVKRGAGAGRVIIDITRGLPQHEVANGLPMATHLDVSTIHSSAVIPRSFSADLPSGKGDAPEARQVHMSTDVLPARTNTTKVPHALSSILIHRDMSSKEPTIVNEPDNTIQPPRPDAAKMGLFDWVVKDSGSGGGSSGGGGEPGAMDRLLFKQPKRNQTNPSSRRSSGASSRGTRVPKEVDRDTPNNNGWTPFKVKRNEPVKAKSGWETDETAGVMKFWEADSGGQRKYTGRVKKIYW